jgi:hypothetical protein
MAFFVTGSPMIVQLHCKGPTGKVSRISAGFAGSMGGPEENGCPILAQLPGIAETPAFCTSGARLKNQPTPIKEASDLSPFTASPSVFVPAYTPRTTLP